MYLFDRIDCKESSLILGPPLIGTAGRGVAVMWTNHQIVGYYRDICPLIENQQTFLLMYSLTTRSKLMKYTSDIKVSLIQSMGGDQMICAAAKVSTIASESLDTKATAGLINYLMKHRHGTPFEHSALTFFVHAPIFVWREWHRHRIGFSYNEESGRYKVLEPVFYLPERDRPMMKVDNWRPGRPKSTLADENTYNELCSNLKSGYEHSYALYQRNLALNIDPGLARDCLPVGIYSSCWVTCNPRSLMAFLSLRTHDVTAKFISYPLYEIEMVAKSCELVLEAGWPLTYKAFIENGRVGP